MSKGAVWSDAKNARSRRVVPLENETLRVLARHRKAQAEERWPPARSGRTTT